MSRLRIRPHDPDTAGVIIDVTPKSAGWTYVGFKVVKLNAGEFHSDRYNDREVCLVIMTGTAHVTVESTVFEAVGDRKTVFEDRAPGAVYVPSGKPYRVVAQSDVEVAICSGPAGGDHEARLLNPLDMPTVIRGRGTNTRYIRNILPEDKPAQSLLIVEVITPSGHWSSYPPHKHDTATPSAETALEETYYHRLSPPQGFAVQRVYTEDRTLDELVLVEDGDVVLVPKGYHPVGAAHGYDLYYLNVMAGPSREWIFNNDPTHEWLMDATVTPIRGGG